MNPVDNLILCCLLAAISLASVTGNARSRNDVDDDYAQPHFEYEPGEKWKEQEIDIPPFPSEQNLLPFYVQKPGYEYSIDENSLDVGVNDRIIRYIVFIVSPNGVRNVFYEGMNCDSGTYKTYAYSIGQSNKFITITTQNWRKISPMSAENYRAELHNSYFCIWDGNNSNKKTLIQRLKHPE